MSNSTRERTSAKRKDPKSSSPLSRSGGSSSRSGQRETLKHYKAKVMRRNSYGSTITSRTSSLSGRSRSQDTNSSEDDLMSYRSYRSTDQTSITGPLSYRDSEQTDTRTFMDSETVVSSEHSRSKRTRKDTPSPKEKGGKEARRKARRRNSSDYDHSSANRPAGREAKAKRRSSMTDVKPELKHKRKTSSHYDPWVPVMESKRWNDSNDEEDDLQSRSSKQKESRRLKSKPTMKSNKKNNNSKYSPDKGGEEAENDQPQRLNSQLLRKIGDFRPYFVPLKRKQGVSNPRGQNTQVSQIFSAEDIVGHGPAQILHEGMKNISVASFLHEGVPVIKVSHNKLGTLKRRILTLSEDQTTLFLTHSKMAKGTKNMMPKQPKWTPSKGWNGTYVRALDVSNICHFQVGVISSRWLELSVATHSKKAKKNGESLENDENKKDFFPYMPDPARVASTVTIFHIDPRTGRMDSLDFFIENQDHRRAVVATLALMKYTYDEVSQLVGNEILLYRYIIKDMDLGTNEQGMTEMNESEFLDFCRRLNFNVQNIGKQFREFRKQYSENEGVGVSKNKLPIHECLQFVHLLKGKENPLVDAWRACFGTATCVDALTVLTKFLHGPQNEERVCDVQDARDLVNVMNATELGEELSNRKGSLLTQWQFQEFLRSEWNDIYCPEKRVIDNQRRLDKPLSHYWINSSFRTSSMSDGTPSIHSYTMALLRGCKSIDLNCWDGIFLPSGKCVPIIIPSNEKPEPSFTVSNKLTFRSVVLVVRKYLLENRKTYPIILNLENNCTEPFQQSMVNTMKEFFGKHLFTPTSDRTKELPSPESLRGMVVVNIRKPEKRTKEGYRSRSFCGDSVDAYAKMFNKFEVNGSNSSALRGSSESFTTRPYKNDKLGEGLMSSSLFHHRDFSGYFLESMDLACSQMHGIKDIHVPKIVKEYSDNPDLWRKFNRSHLTRIYPGGVDMNSKDPSSDQSNFNPILSWYVGCQMASLNFHSDDTALAINDGFFRQTGGIGYLEKPRWLLGEGEKPKATSIKIRILSGSCLPKPFVGDSDGSIDDSSFTNPRVIVELHDVHVRSGHGERFKISKHKVNCANKNGFFPIFEDQGKKFPVGSPDVAMLVFRVEQDSSSGKVISTTAVPVSCVRKGYRSVQLYDVDNTRRGHFASASLLVYVM